MLRLKATKTSLYTLVHFYEPLPPMRRTQFTKAPRSPDYWLAWTDSCGLCCKAFLSTCAGEPLLSITRCELWGTEVSRVVHELALSDLQERGMVEEFARPMGRRCCLDADAKKSPGGLEAPPGEGKQSLP